mmetsp:Transcript_21293/g.39783  ORF Transcript_21293/g.39783 Transcript_21293/m.39783 type:complete len:99 (+) Transcript_21293:131-427(+)
MQYWQKNSFEQSEMLQNEKSKIFVCSDCHEYATVTKRQFSLQQTCYDVVLGLHGRKFPCKSQQSIMKIKGEPQKVCGPFPSSYLQQNTLESYREKWRL